MHLSRSPFGRLLRRAFLEAHRENLLEESDGAAAASFGRREFLKAGLASGAAAMLPSCVSTSESKEVIHSDKVAIIGGGTSGMTAAYKLREAGIQSEIFEASQRFGGRMYTQRNFNGDGQFCERGGELIDTNHHRVIELAGRLGLHMQRLDIHPHKGEDLYHFGGRIYTHAQAVKAFKPLARIIHQDQQKLRGAHQQFTPYARQLDGVSLGNYLRRLAEHSDPWIIGVLSTAYVTEIGGELEEQSCLNLVDFIGTKDGEFEVFGESDEAWRIEGGNEGLPIALTRTLEKTTAMNLGHQLVRIRDAGGRLHLTFEVKDGPVKTIAFSKVINTLPFPLLKKVDGVAELAVSPAKRRVINEFRIGRNSKLMTSYSARVWEKEKDLPASSNGNVYSDSGFQVCWDTSRAQKGSRGILTNFMGGRHAVNASTPEQFIDKVETVFKGVKSHYENESVLMNWVKHRFTRGSYTMIAPGQYVDFPRAAAESSLGGRLVFAGEQTSLVSAGFMNGAVDAGERAARTIIGSRQRV